MPSLRQTDYHISCSACQKLGMGRRLINEKGSSAYTKEELQVLKRKLKEANETLRVLNKN